ncbi:hypothetical protein WN943_009214 [Citrus x changshan-huyou]
MGLCYGTPVDDGPSKPPSPGSRTGANSLTGKENKADGLEMAGGINDVKDEHERKADDADEGRQLGDGDGGDKNMPSSGEIVTPNYLKMFTLQDLRAATKNFRPDTMLGEGGFGRVFKGWVDHKTLAPTKVGVGKAVAVKKSNPDSIQGLREWQAEVKFLGKFSHPNLVKLIGYCWEDRQFLLVYEYMQKGSLENHLFRKGSAEPLPWNTRLKIAIDAAKGLTFLHSSEKSVIYRDFKASNILLDGSYNAKLSDFGLAKLGPIDGNSHVTTRIMGTYGYAAPEYVATGHLYVKSDVYGFGVVLLEMLTGLRALDTNRPSGEHVLVDFARPSLTDKRRLKKIMDPRLEEQYPIKGALLAGQIIIKCLEAEPKNRPSMEEVLETLQNISVIEIEPKKKAKARGNYNNNSNDNQRGHPHNRRSQSPLHSKHGDHNNGTRARRYHY